MIFAPRRLLREPDEIWTGDVVMVAYLAPPHPGEKAFRVICVGLSLVKEAIGFFVVDPVQGEPSCQSVPRSSLIGVERRLRRDPLANKVERIALVAEHAR